MGHAILRKNLVRDVESASIPQFLDESVDDVSGWLHWRAPRLANSILYAGPLVADKSRHCYGIITRNIKRRPLFTVSLSRVRTTPTEKERLYESRQVYRHGRACRHHLRCREECRGQAADGVRAGNQGSHDCGVRSRTAWHSLTCWAQSAGIMAVTDIDRKRTT